MLTASGVDTTFNPPGSGTFTVGLRVTDVDGASDTDTASVVVANIAPFADAGGPYSGDQGAAITVSGSASSDPGNDIVGYAWDLDNDGFYDDATGVSAAFSSALPGTFTVGLRVTDADGDSGTAMAGVTVNDTAPAQPVGLSAVAGNGQVVLDWTDNGEADLAGYRVQRSQGEADLAGYRVQRSQVPGGPYSEIAGLLAASGYIDTAALNGTTYYYVVSAEDTAGNGSVPSAEASATPLAGPLQVSYWRLDEGGGPTTADAVGGNDGTLVGASWAEGVSGTALAFDGSNDYVSIADSASLDFSGFTGATVALWVKPGRLNAADEQTLYGHWNGSSAARPFQILLGTDNRWQCRSNHSDGSVNSVSVATLDTWTHVACAWSPQGLTVYVDGVAEVSDTTVESSLDANNGLHTLGAREKSGALSQFFLGELDEVQLYDVTLSASEVFAVYSTTAPGSNSAPLVNAGGDVTIRLPLNTVTLTGSASDDGEPGGTLSTLWSGPAGASFTAAGSLTTDVSFTSAGTYTLQLR
jgi:hypothetical protein